MKSQPAPDTAKLIFLDETGAATDMTRRYGWAPKGQRCVADAPHHWKTTTLVAGLRRDEISAPMVLEGAMDGPAFLGSSGAVPVPHSQARRPRDGRQPLQPQGGGNAKSHGGGGGEPAVSAALRAGVQPHSKRCSPSSKGLLRKAKERAQEALWKQIGQLLDKFTPQECRHYFTSSGYVAS